MQWRKMYVFYHVLWTQCPDSHIYNAQMLQPKYTMNGLGVHDAMRANGSVHNRVLRVLLRSNLPLLQSGLQAAIAASFAKELALGTVENEGVLKAPAFYQ